MENLKNKYSVKDEIKYNKFLENYYNGIVSNNNKKLKRGGKK